MWEWQCRSAARAVHLQREDMVKLLTVASLFASLITAQQGITIQLAPDGAQPPKPIRVVRTDAAMAAKATPVDSVGSISAPISGYVLDPAGGVRPILGFGMFSVIGGAWNLDENIAAAVPSPNQNYLVEVATNGLASLWVSFSGGLGQVAFPSDVSETSSVTPSPLGFSIAVVSRKRGTVQVFTSVPTSPMLAFSATFSELGGVPNSLAVSDDGSTLLYTIQDRKLASLHMIQNGRVPQLVEGGSFSSVAFAPNSLDSAAAEATGNRVYLLRYSNRQYAVALLAEGSNHISHTVAIDFSRDGQQVLVADGELNTIRSFRLDGTEGLAARCDCAIEMLTRLTGNAVFQITRFDGARAMIFDGDVDPASVVAISALKSGMN